jgi:hypothetical protein
VVNLLWRRGLARWFAIAPVTDVADTAPFAGAVDWAVDVDVASALPDGRFSTPEQGDPRPEAVMLHRLASTAPAWGDVTLPSTVEF